MSNYCFFLSFTRQPDLNSRKVLCWGCCHRLVEGLQERKLKVGTPPPGHIKIRVTFHSSASPECPAVLGCCRLADHTHTQTCSSCGKAGLVLEFEVPGDKTRHLNIMGGLLAATYTPAPSAPWHSSLETQAYSGGCDVRATWPEGNGAGTCFHLFSPDGISIFLRFAKPGGLPSMESQRVRHNLACTCMQSGFMILYEFQMYTDDPGYTHFYSLSNSNSI